jgi:hypothetical protein
MARVRVLFLIAACVVIIATSGGVWASEIPPELVEFSKQTDSIAGALATQIAKCVVRKDTDNPAFHGCIDWHSAAHGTWALIAYTEGTGDQRYVAVVKSILTASNLEKERAHLTADPAFEMPYGRAWFLRLAIDYRSVFHDEMLTAFADDVAASLKAFYIQHPPDPQSREYQNSSWALINMADYARTRHDEHLQGFVEQEVRERFLQHQKPCPLDREESEWPDFMAVCTNWAWLVGKALPHDQFVTWLNNFIPTSEALTPITNPLTAHQNGLDFSRAWGFWGIYDASGDPRFVRAYVDHFNAAYMQPVTWRGPYDTVGHWVAQFGMFALTPMFALHGHPVAGAPDNTKREGDETLTLR